MTRYLNISRDNTLGGSSPSHEAVSSQRAIKEYVDGLAGQYDMLVRKVGTMPITINTTYIYDFNSGRHLVVSSVEDGVTAITIEADTDNYSTHCIIIDNTGNRRDLKVRIGDLRYNGDITKRTYSNGLSVPVAAGGSAKIRITLFELEREVCAVVEWRNDFERKTN